MRTLGGYLRCLVVAGALLTGPSALAVQPDEILPDAALEARARNLSKELRCMVCQNQSIDDSDAPLARDLRLLVRERLKAGDSDRQVMDFLTSRYGDFVLLRPRFGWDTAILWLAPGLVLLIGAWGLFVLARRRQGDTESAGRQPPQLSAAEQSRLSEVLGGPKDSAGPTS